MKNEKKKSDDEIRRLVIARLSALSADSMKSIGGEGVFTREQQIKHVEEGDEIGQTIEKIHMEWLEAQKEGIINKLYE